MYVDGGGGLIVATGAPIQLTLETSLMKWEMPMSSLLVLSRGCLCVWLGPEETGIDGRT